MRRTYRSIAPSASEIGAVYGQRSAMVSNRVVLASNRTVIPIVCTPPGASVTAFSAAFAGSTQTK